MALADWTDENVLALIDELRNHRCLLSPRDEDGRPQKKLSKNQALEVLSATFGAPALKLRQKINSLLQSYRMHKRKIEASNGGFKPTWFAYDSMQRMMEDTGCVPHASFTGIKDEIISIDDNESDGEINGSDSNASHNVTPNEMNTNENIKTFDESGQTDLKRQLDSTPKQLQKKIKTEMDENEVHINKAYDNLVQKKKETEDECVIFGTLIATRLKSLDEFSRQYIMCEINNLFFQTKMHGSNRTPQFNHPDTNVNHSYLSQSSAFNHVVPYSDSRQPLSFDYVHPYPSQQMRPTQVSAFSCVPQSSSSEPSALSHVSEPSSISTVSSALQPSLPLIPYNQPSLYNNYTQRPYPSQKLHQTQLSAFSRMSQPSLSDSSEYLNHHISEPFSTSTIRHTSRGLVPSTSSQMVDYDWLNASHQ